MSSSATLVVYVIAGIGGHFGQYALMPHLRSLNIKVYATRHDERNPPVKEGVTYITSDEALAMAERGEIDNALWLAPKDQPDAVRTFTERGVPTLSISSMSLAAHVMSGKPSREELSTDPKLSYQWGKLQMLEVKGATSLAPGYYLQDVDCANGKVRGLHSDTWDQLMRTAHAPTTLDHNKVPMSVTPEAELARVIGHWLLHTSAVIKPNTFTVFCSDGEYSRERLRLYALGEHVNAPRDQFSALPHPLSADGTAWRVPHEAVERIMRAQWLQGEVKRQKIEVNVE